MIIGVEQVHQKDEGDVILMENNNKYKIKYKKEVTMYLV